MSARKRGWRGHRRGRAVALALLVTWAGLALSAAVPQSADAVLPQVLGGEVAKGLFGGGSSILDAPGALVLKGVQAILDWIYGG